MRFFTTKDEDLRSTTAARQSLRGDFASLPGGVTHFEFTGPADGEVVLLVPGLTVPLFYWDETVPHFHRNGFRTLAFSAYGRGYSERVVGRYDERMFVRQLRELVQHLGIRSSVHLVGTSMGALIALAFAAEAPWSVRTLTVLGPAGLSTSTARQQRLLRIDPLAKVVAKTAGRRILLGHLEHNVSDPALVPQLTRMIAECYRYEGSMYSFFSTLQNYPLSGREELFRLVGALRIPTLLAWGTEDRVTPISGLDSATALLQPRTVEVLDGCGHMAPFERPQDTADLLTSFFDSRHDRTSS